MKFIQWLILLMFIFSVNLFAEVMPRNEDNGIFYSSVFYNVDKFSKVVLTQNYNERRGDEIFLRLTMAAENRMEFGPAVLYSGSSVIETDIVDSSVSTVDEGKYVSTVIYRVYVLDKDDFVNADDIRLEIKMDTRKDIVWLIPLYVFDEWKELIKKNK
ncbi:MAG: hypothetical protein PHP69_05905 [Candidatus Omnitrophica bacterium]|nr:hypothetical protein [Candidatus Omnitrophota bacterium]MDD5081475.1 hypothetical protein [Candidatus Omnitrophota bacterium]